MNLTIEMDQPQARILEEIADRSVGQKSIALTYGFLIAQEGDKADWAKVNRAIRERWKGKSALIRIKKLAWAQIEIWGNGKVAA
jgi:hypothetical protein